MMSLQYLSIEETGTTFAYIDSGAPPSAESCYPTFLLIHGLCFSSGSFSRLCDEAHNQGARVVAINRREYRGSTPFTEEEKAVYAAGNDEAKTRLLTSIGMDIAWFLDQFIQKEGLSPVSPDGSSGGVAVSGWSSGNVYGCATIAAIEVLPAVTRDRLGGYIRGHILYDPPSMVFDFPNPPKMWTPYIDNSIPEGIKSQWFVRWMTSYFDHGDLSSHDLEVLEYSVPSLKRVPTAWSIPSEELENMVETVPGDGSELPFIFGMLRQSRDAFEKAVFDDGIKKRLPHLKTALVLGSATASFGIASLWHIEEEDKAHGGNNVKFTVIDGGNHFVHWDDPDKTLKAFCDAL